MVRLLLKCPVGNWHNKGRYTLPFFRNSGLYPNWYSLFNFTFFGALLPASRALCDDGFYHPVLD